MTDPTQTALLDRLAIADIINAYSYGIDLRDWARYRGIFADEIHVDLAWSGVDRRMPADEWVANVHAGLAAFDATQHRMTNLDVTVNGAEATARAQMTARHVLQVEGVSRSHLIGGYYHHRLHKFGNDWKITTLGLTIRWEEGDRGLFDQAAALGPRARADVGLQGLSL